MQDLYTTDIDGLEAAASTDALVSRVLELPVALYSRNMGDAYRLIQYFKDEWMKQSSGEDDEPLVWTIYDCHNQGWRVDINWLHHDGPMDVISAKADTLALAIVKTALKLWEFENYQTEVQPQPSINWRPITIDDNCPF